MKLENEQAVVTFTLQGAEIQSFTDKATDIQYMWQGDDTYWSGKNPTLFPMVGSTWDKGSYEIDGKTYTMKNHGFIRNSTFTLFEQDDHRIVFELKANEETLSRYPFPFTFHTIYELKGKKLTISYEIYNNGDKDMPFRFGLHPGFNCPLMKDETFEDYTISFDQEEKLTFWKFDHDDPKGATTEKQTLKQLPLSYDLFETYQTLMYSDIISGYVNLMGKHGHGVRVGISGYPYLALWTQKRGAPYLCIEPWQSYGELCKQEVPFAKREGMLSLSPDCMYTTAYTIEII